MTQPAPRTVRFLLHHPSQNQGFREMLGPKLPTVVRTTSGKIQWESRVKQSPHLTLLWIPPGRFWMGSPETEPERRDSEGPQHLVQLQGFFMSQTPITQAQWREVAGWKEGPGEQWGRELKLDPSRFQSKGEKANKVVRLLEGESNNDQHPVENVNWWEAMEFCHRLSKRTGRIYALPSEAQWEYACRAGTTTPFHFGDMISSELANYNGNYAYADGPKGIYQGRATPVGMLPANAWGLYDMHGNVLEWCLDEWHESYEGAPTDGRAWVDAAERENSKESKKRRLLRSWHDFPGYCRSAYRYHAQPVYALFDAGFRVVCLPQDPSLNP